MHPSCQHLPAPAPEAIRLRARSCPHHVTVIVNQKCGKAVRLPVTSCAIRLHHLVFFDEDTVLDTKSLDSLKHLCGSLGSEGLDQVILVSNHATLNSICESATAIATSLHDRIEVYAYRFTDGVLCFVQD